jgi:hypothetical protein
MRYALSHAGTPRHSGRYPWGSGKDPQRSKDFLSNVDTLRKQGLSDGEIARGMKINSTRLRIKISIANDDIKKDKIAQAWRLKEKGLSNVAIGERMGGLNESSVRDLLKPNAKLRSEMTDVTANMLKDSVASKGYIDIGAGVEHNLGVSRTKLKTAIAKLEEEGYLVSYPQEHQLGTNKSTNLMVLSLPKDPKTRYILQLKSENVPDDEIPKITGAHPDEIKQLLKDAYVDVYKNKGNIKLPVSYSEDGGLTSEPIKPPKSVSSDRVYIRYHEDGGTEKDGVVELRRDVPDISLGTKRYAQVRIGVNDTHFMKGMAVYSDDIPKGFDMVYNTNKKLGVAKEKVFKVMKADMDDPNVKKILSLDISKDEKDKLIDKGLTEGHIKPDWENPFGATTKQKDYDSTDVDGMTEGTILRQKHYDVNGEKKQSSLNIVNEEGDWGKWTKTLSAQMLSKQKPALAKQQLGLAFDAKKKEFDDIMALTNPLVKKKLLESFSDDADSSAVHLKGAAMPRQGSHVILPLQIKENEIYAPNFANGEKVVLIRYPHGGIFEIPELTVNNKTKSADIMRGAEDAVGIHPKVAEKLSGADFDGDTVLVIPNTNKQIKTAPPLKDLKDFDPKIYYDSTLPKMKDFTKQREMGGISNLITDMTIKGANDDELARAVKHSMVVIDAQKHGLNYRQSAIDNNISLLKQTYQGGKTKGSSTLISRSSSEISVPFRKYGRFVTDPDTEKKKRMYIDPFTGKKQYEYEDASYVNKLGLTVKKTVKSTKMAEVDDAFKLSSGFAMENIYATHANKLKALANDARKSMIVIKPPLYSKSAKETYAEEVKSLLSKLRIAEMNKPLERQAQSLGNVRVDAKKIANPGMEKAELKKLKGRELILARARMGASKQQIEITDREWEAIQSGAISSNRLSAILDNTNMDKIKQLATPKTSVSISASKIAIAKSMVAKGRTRAEIADRLGVSIGALAKLDL